MNITYSGSIWLNEGKYNEEMRTDFTTGANGTGTYFVIMNKIAHTSQKVGLASAMSVVLLMIIFICTILQNVFFKYVFRDAASEDESYKAKKARLKAEKQVIKQIKKQ